MLTEILWRTKKKELIKREGVYKGARKGTFFLFADFNDDAPPQQLAEFSTQSNKINRMQTLSAIGILFLILFVPKRIRMNKNKFYQTVYKLVEDYFNNFSKKPSYLLINSKFDLAKFIDQEDLKQYVQDRFKGMMIVRTPDISEDKIIVY